MFNNFNVHFKDYVESLPQNMSEAAIRSGCYSFVLGALCTCDLKKGMYTGLIASTLSVISSLMMPIFRDYLADDEGFITWSEHAVITVVNLSITQLVISTLMNKRVNLVNGAFFTVFSTLLLNRFEDRSTWEAQAYIFL